MCIPNQATLLISSLKASFSEEETVSEEKTISVSIIEKGGWYNNFIGRYVDKTLPRLTIYSKSSKYIA